MGHQQRLNAEILPHAFAVLQTLMLILDVTSFFHIPSIVTGHRLGETQKVITPPQLWIFAFSLVLVTLFYLARERSRVEKSLVLFSILTCLSSSLNLALFLVDDLLVGMQITATLAMVFYLTVFVISASKVSVLLLLYVWRKTGKRLAKLIRLRPQR